MDIFDFAGCGNFAQSLRAATTQAMFPESSLPYFLGQISVESRYFQRVEESLNYRAETLLRVCNGRNGIKTLDDAAQAVASGFPAIGEALYGIPWGTRLGNVNPGDGFRFRGRGLIQITGRSNYAQASKAMFQDDRLVQTPELLTLASEAARSACWFYGSRGLVNLTDVVAITRGVNGGQEGLADRQAVTTKLLQWVADQQ